MVKSQGVFLWALASAIALAPIAAPTLRADDETSPQADVFGGYSSQRIIVRFNASAAERIAHAEANNRTASIIDPRDQLSAEFNNVSRSWRVSRVRPVHTGSFRDPARAHALQLDRLFVVEVPAKTDTMTMSTAVAALGDEVEAAYVDAIGGVASEPDDPDFRLQYALNNVGQIPGGQVDADIDALEAWAIHTGELNSVTIAILDSGVDPHPEFSSRMVAGYNTNDPLGPGITADACPHGTHVAGIAAASGNNGIGIAGVSWGAQIMPVRVLGGCSGPVSDLLSGIMWAVDNGADVINMSLQYYNLSSEQVKDLQKVVDYAHGLGVVLVAAAGNNNLGGAGVVAFPARLDNVVAVSATDERDLFASFSNYGSQVDICAPGKNILSTWTGGGYYYEFGTSMSAPHVSGGAALLWSYRPDLTGDQVVDVLLATSDDLGAVGRDSYYGNGRLNVYSALDQVDCVAEVSGVEAVGVGPVSFSMNRSISFEPGNANRPTAIRIKLASLHHPDPPYSDGKVAGFSAFEGEYRWVGPAQVYEESESSGALFAASMLQCTPYYADWSKIGFLYVVGAGIMPSSSYEVQSIPEECFTGSEFSYSAPLLVMTSRWGDVEEPFNPPSTTQQPDIADVSAIVNKFRSAPGSLPKARAILTGDIPNLLPDIGFDQISACVDAFKGFSYPYAGLNPCPAD